MKTKYLSKLIAVATILVILLVSSVHFFAKKTNVYISGSVSIAEPLENYSRGINTLYLTLFDAVSGSPMPWGAQKVLIDGDKKSGEFYHFVLTEDNLQRMNPMGGERPTPERFRIKARLDLNGQGGMDQPGDMTGEVSDTVYGSTEVRIIISKRVGSTPSVSTAHP